AALVMNHSPELEILADTKKKLPPGQTLTAHILNDEASRIQIVANVQTDWPHRSSIPQTCTQRVRDVAEILRIFLMLAQADIVEAAKHISHIVKHDTADLSPDGKPQLQTVQQQCISAQRIARDRIAGAGLIHCKTAVRIYAAGKEML